jgi:3-hydroxybutyryl-CoA dehydratase
MISQGSKKARIDSVTQEGTTVDWRSQATKGISPGARFRFSRTFTAEETEIFGDITRDYNPVHYDQRFAAAKSFPELIAHGLLVGGMICEFGGQVAWLASGMSFSFKKPVYFGDTITCAVTITAGDKNHRARAEAVFTNQRGETVMTGTLTGYLPGPADRGVLKTMTAEGDPTNRLRGRSDEK